MKTYIMPTGWDRELVIKTAFKSGADKICLISAKQKKKHSYSNADKITSKVNNYLLEQLSKFTKVEFLEVNYIDIKDIIIEINKYLKENSNEEFKINISTGSHLLASALMFIGFTKNIPLEYSIAKSHNKKLAELVEKGEDFHQGFSEIIKIPLINSKIKFSSKELKLLKLLKKKKKICVKDFIEGVKGNDENRLRSEFHFLCKKLENKGLIEINTKGNKVLTSLTHFGQIIIEDL
ncbi:MAG: DUF6293 family protein [Candidatus Pacearchaeota archaeon]|nr:DUF6293 family protein [Candidatus Pacearchaeota archaeon]